MKLPAILGGWALAVVSAALGVVWLSVVGLVTMSFGVVYSVLGVRRKPMAPRRRPPADAFASPSAKEK